MNHECMFPRNQTRNVCKGEIINVCRRGCNVTSREEEKLKLISIQNEALSNIEYVSYLVYINF